jgi:flagellar biosynthesis component FlhA
MNATQSSQVSRSLAAGAAGAVALTLLHESVRRMIEASLPQVAVLAYNEIVPEVAVEAVGLVGMNG